MISRILRFFRNIFSKAPVAVPPPIVQAPPPVIAPIPSHSRITVGDITGATDGEAQMIKVAIGYVIQVVYSPLFKTAVLAANFTNTNGLSNQQIYDLYVNTDMVVNVDDFTGTWKQDHLWHTMGYEAGDGYVHANRSFVTDAVTMMSLIMHELAHEPLGFHHDSATEYTSVPYSMNTISEAVASQLGIR